MPAQLLPLTKGPSILLDKPILLFGRNPECDIQIDSRKISRRHCCIAQVNGYLVVRDLGSTNGIRINGIRVLEGKLKSGDELMIGGNRYKVLLDAADAQAKHAAPADFFEPEPHCRTVRAEDDEVFESSDEPVRLPEPGPVRGRPTPAMVPKTALEDIDRGIPSTPPVQVSPLIPDDLELKPESQVVPKEPESPKE